MENGSEPQLHGPAAWPEHPFRDMDCARMAACGEGPEVGDVQETRDDSDARVYVRVDLQQH